MESVPTTIPELYAALQADNKTLLSEFKKYEAQTNKRLVQLEEEVAAIKSEDITNKIRQQRLEIDRQKARIHNIIIKRIKIDQDIV